jgi:hypothetical protein
MVKRLLLASATLCASPAFAFPQPPDVAAYVPWTPQYTTNGTQNVPIDPTVTPPPQAGLTNIPAPSYTNRLITTAAQGPGSPYCTLNYNGGTCQENKGRLSIDFGYMLPDDPIRNYAQPGQSHLHCFFGAGSANANSTYKTLRQHSIDSTSAGTDANGSAYWHPCVTVLNPYADGKNYALKDDYLTVYYQGEADTTIKAANIPPGLRPVWGYNMDDQYASLIAILNAANTAQGRTRYTLTQPSTGQFNTQAVYSCEGATPASVTVLKTAAGADPYGGTCSAGFSFHIDINGPQCWDGTNLWSPGGYSHVIPKVWDQDFSKWVCPYNSYVIPFVRLEIIIHQDGWTDRQRWDLSSDIALRASKGWTTAQLPPGTSFHTDELFAWDDVVLQQMEANCMGTKANTGAGHECNSGYISSTQYLKGAITNEPGAGNRSPQVDFTPLSHTLQTDPGWMLIPPSWSGALTNMHMHN